jgi:3D (Asp-Asp-Asp) domain-containing protein
MNATNENHTKTVRSESAGKSWLRRLAINLFCFALVSLPLWTGNIENVQSKQENIALSEHMALISDRNEVIAGRNETIANQLRTIDQLEGILSYAFDQEYSGQAFKTMTVTATAYTAREEECNSEPWITASGTPSRVGVIAVSRDMEKLGIKLGDVIIIKGMGMFRVEDRMNKRWKNRVDILHANLQAAKLFAKRQVEIMWFDDAGPAARG